MTKPLVVVVCLLLVGVPCQTVTGTEYQAFTGNEYRAAPEATQIWFLVGVFSTWVAIREMMEHPKWQQVCVDDPTLIKRIMTCQPVNGTYAQFKAMVEKYMAQHPEEWHLPMAHIAMGAALSLCPK